MTNDDVVLLLDDLRVATTYAIGGTADKEDVLAVLDNLTSTVCDIITAIEKAQRTGSYERVF